MTVDLHALYASLASPRADGGFVFTTAHVEGTSKSVRLGRSNAGPALLFEVTDSTPGAPIQLRNIEVAFNVSCGVESETGSTTAHFTVVRCTSESEALQRLFLDAAAVLVSSTPAGNAAIGLYIETLVEMFRALPHSPVTSAIGLWGELFVLSKSTDVDLMIRSWHTKGNDRFDFAFDSERIEVKTSSAKRHHRFSLEQLKPPDGISLWVTSIVTESSAAGLSILDLVEEVAGRSTEPDIAGKLLASVGRALGEQTTDWSELRFDQHRAAQSLRLIPGSIVPKFDTPEEVWDVKFTVDLTNVEDPGSQGRGPLATATAQPR